MGRYPLGENASLPVSLFYNLMSQSEKVEIVMRGIAASPGVAHGPAFLFLQKEVEIPSYEIPEQGRGFELARFEQAILETRMQISAMRNEIASELGEEEAQIFDAHLLVLDDKALLEETVHEVENSGLNIEYCVHKVITRYIEAFASIDDDYIKERVTDIRDVSRRLLRNLMGHADFSFSKLAENKIIVSEDLTPSETANLEKGTVLAFVTDEGSSTSHVSIMARSIEVPAVVALHTITSQVHTGDTLLVDGYEGLVILNPTEARLQRYGRIKLEKEQLQQVYQSEACKPAETRDGQSLVLMANIEGVTPPDRLIKYGAQGVGLFRTESIFLRDMSFPDEETQFQIYKSYVEQLNPQSVFIRTLDLGGDKSTDGKYFPDNEGNPFMGFRAIRFCLEQPEIFKDQLRAILRSSAYGKTKIMYPMISGLPELLAANKILEEAKEDLLERGQAFDPHIQVGSMIEIPSAAYTSDLLAEHCQFFSIGTNDLIQYMLAVDRVNDRIAHLYQPNHPAVIRIIKAVIDSAHKKGIPVGICGEMACDPLYAPLLIGMGADELSLMPVRIPEIKYLLRKIKMSDARSLVEKVINYGDAQTIYDTLRQFYLDHVNITNA